MSASAAFAAAEQPAEVAAGAAPAETPEDHFSWAADVISAFIGTPLNIGIWLVIVAAWIALFACHILNPQTDLLPAWFTSNAFNFPLNTVTTLAELYIGFLLAAAANRVEKRNWQLHQTMLAVQRHVETLVVHVEALVEKDDDKLDGLHDAVTTLRNELRTTQSGETACAPSSPT